MLDTAVLHIGMNKTGTSAIQSGLALNRARLRDLGYHYPEAKQEEDALEGRVTAGNGSMFTRFNDLFEQRKFDPGDLDEYLNSIIAAGASKSLIFSSERMAGYDPDFAAILGAALKARFNTVRIVILVRHVADHALSQYGEAVKRRGMTLDFETYARDRYVCKFENYARRAAHAYGRENLSVVLYDDVAGKVFDAFLETAGIPSGGFQQPGWVNRSLSATELALIRRMNGLTTNPSLVAKIVSEFSTSTKMRGEPMRATEAAVDAIAETSAGDLAYINGEFPLTSPLLNRSARLPIGEDDKTPPDVEMLTAMVESAVKGADTYSNSLRVRKEERDERKVERREIHKRRRSLLEPGGLEQGLNGGAPAELPEDLKARRDRRDRRAARRERKAAKAAKTAAPET